MHPSHPRQPVLRLARVHAGLILICQLLGSMGLSSANSLQAFLEGSIPAGWWLAGWGPGLGSPQSL
jgi:hypothetical protein